MIVETEDISDPCDFCDKPASIRIHVLFTCMEHATIICDEILRERFGLTTYSPTTLPHGKAGDTSTL